uniref:AlkB homolog 8, tRNA methyltransferase n=1 Tax=Oryzias sinensis TaxID=183150 RepID=A0A8C8DZG6_9TELE
RQPHKSYSHPVSRSEDGARKAHANLNGWKLQCGESSITLYLSYVDSEAASVPLPEGLALVEHFVSPEEEAQLLNVIDWSPTQGDVTAQKSLKHRRVKHYGFEFRYDINNVDKDKPLAAGLPDECVPILQRCVEQGHTNVLPDQLTVNQYESGQGIPPHVDTHSAFEDTILSLSLGAKTVMEFRHPDGRVAAVVLPERSLLVMKGESRYLWSVVFCVRITPRKVDMVPAEAPRAGAPTEPGIQSNLTLSRRGTRTSFTFRKIRHEPCRCAFPSACDSQGAPSPSPGPSLPSCPADAARLEEEYVHRVYSTIASHFSDTRHTPWPRVCHFLSSLPSGSVLADVGCGNGKYLGVNADLVTVGCDRSTALVQICAARGYHAFVSDALSVPLRTASCDACISIAVIHHFSTAERRLAAVKELVRLLKPGGQALIYVWAFEQEYNKQKSKYLKQIFKEDHGEFSSTNLLSEKSQKSSGEQISDPSCHLENSHKPSDNMQGVSRVPDAHLSVHTNRTAFISQDLLVPWHLKGGKSQQEENPDLSSSQASASALKLESGTVPVFHRYYHVFQQGELEHLCAQVSGVKVKSSYHDQGNWCVVLQKE